jgi:uncharacterized protein
MGESREDLHMHENKDSSLLEPIPRAARIEALDFVRGLALLGILFINMPVYNAPVYAVFHNDVSGWYPAWYDKAAVWLIRFVAESKFYTLLTFVFGVGFGVQLSRAAARGMERFGWFYSRRLLVLLVLGLAHLLLIWSGDVLHVYALVGFLLLPFRKRRQKTVLIWALCLTILPWISTAAYVTVRAVRDTPEQQAERQRKRAEERAKLPQELRAEVETNASGSRGQVLKLRAKQAVEGVRLETLWALFEMWPMFLLGLWVARRGFLEDLPGHLPVIRRLFWWGLIVGVGLSLGLAIWRVRLGTDAPPLLSFFHRLLGNLVARPFHALFYATGLVLLLQSEAWRRRLEPLAAVGRLPLTNYIGQSLLCVTLFYGVGFGFGGFGLFGKVAPAAGLALMLVVWAVQIAFSAWWSARYRFGPVEWLWRSLAYGEPQRMRLEPPAGAEN